MKKRNAVLLSTPYLIWMVLFTLIPLGVVVYYALTDPGTGEFSFINIRQMGSQSPGESRKIFPPESGAS